MKQLLKDLYPRIYEQIVTEDNTNVNIEKLTCGSGKKLLWRCPHCEAYWRTTVMNRTINHTNCPFCAPKNPRVSNRNSLAAKRPDLLQFWDYSKNRDVTPDSVSYCSHKKVWWICMNNKEHSYLFSVQARCMSKKNHKCPVCKKEKRLKNMKIIIIPEKIPNSINPLIILNRRKRKTAVT